MSNKSKRSFDVYVPVDGAAPKLVETIQVEVYENFGQEFLTPESLDAIESAKAKHLGLLRGADIRRLRNRLGLTQAQLASEIKCGAKSITRWENGSGYPSGLVNTILRLLSQEIITLDDLRLVSGPIQNFRSKQFFENRVSNIIPFNVGRMGMASLKEKNIYYADCS